MVVGVWVLLLLYQIVVVLKTVTYHSIHTAVATLYRFLGLNQCSSTHTEVYSVHLQCRRAVGAAHLTSTQVGKSGRHSRQCCTSANVCMYERTQQ